MKEDELRRQEVNLNSTVIKDKKLMIVAISSNIILTPKSVCILHWGQMNKNQIYGVLQV